MRRIAFAFSAIAVFATAAMAGPIEDRQAFMKQNGRLLGALGPMAKGEQPFDAAQAIAMLQAFNEHSQTLDVAAMFPEGSEEGDTRASPKIWEDMAGFQAAVDEFKADAAAAAAANPQDVEALQAQMAAVGANCGSCHEAYRLSRD